MIVTGYRSVTFRFVELRSLLPSFDLFMMINHDTRGYLKIS